MPETWMARHVIGLNHYAIGIENIGGIDGKDDLTEAQVKANAFLVCFLKNKYPEIKYVIGHNEYLNFKKLFLYGSNVILIIKLIKTTQGISFLIK